MAIINDRNNRNCAEWLGFVSQYRREFKRCNVSGAKLYELQELINSGRLCITVTREKYTRPTPAGRWSKKPVNSESEAVPAWYYANYITGLAFFGGRVDLSYTSYGYIATGFSAISPDGCTKAVTRFAFGEVKA